MNILITINKNCTKQLNMLLFSIQITNKNSKFNIYVLNRDLDDDDISAIEKNIDLDRFFIKNIKMDESQVKKLPMFNGRYPVEIFFRLLATKYLPKELDRVLYLDTDVIVINELNELYNMDFEENYFIATTHIKQVLHKVNEIRLGIKENEPYINTGVLLMNLKKIRDEINLDDEVIAFIEKNKKILMLPDQDVISMMYANKTKIVDELKYNLGDRGFNIYNLNNPKNKIGLKWVCKNTVIIHYYSRNKPNNDNYIGRLGCFYYKIEKKLNELNGENNKKI